METRYGQPRYRQRGTPLLTKGPAPCAVPLLLALLLFGGLGPLPRSVSALSEQDAPPIFQQEAGQAYPGELSTAETGTLAAALSAAVHAPAVRQKVADYHAARIDAAAAGYRGDLSFSIKPSVRTDFDPNERGSDDGSSVRYQAGASLETVIPLGLNAQDADRLNRATLALRQAESELREEVFAALVAIYAAYTDAFLATRELPVLEAELEAASSAWEASEARYQAGELAFLRALDARDDFSRAERRWEEGLLDAESAWLTLIMETGSDAGGLSDQTASALEADASGSLFPAGMNGEQGAPRLGCPAGAMSELDVPSLEHVLESLRTEHPRVVRQLDALEAARGDTEIARDPVFSSARLSYSGAGQGASISYSRRDPSLALSYDPPRLSFGDASEQDRNSGHTLTVSASFSLSAGAARTHDEEAAAVRVQKEAARFDSIVRSIEADIYARHRRMVGAEAGLELAERAEERAQAALATARVRDDLGTGLPGELLAAEAGLMRAEYEVTRAQVTLVVEQLRYVHAAHRPESLPPLVQEIIDTEMNGGVM